MRAVLLLLFAAWHAAAAESIATNRIVTFTNLQGRWFRNVVLVKADAEGIIWRSGASGGREAYTNLHPHLAQQLGLSTNAWCKQAAGAVKPQPTAPALPRLVRSWSGRPSRWQQVRIWTFESNSPAFYQCAAAPLNPGDPPVPGTILVQHLPADLAAIPQQIQEEEAKLNRLQKQQLGLLSGMNRQAQAALSPNPFNPIGSTNDPTPADMRRFEANLKHSGISESLGRIEVAQAEYDTHKAMITTLQQRLLNIRLKLFFTGYLVNGVELWDAGP